MTQRRSQFAVHNLVTFVELVAPLRMADENMRGSSFPQHCRRYLTGVRTLFLPVHVLAGHLNVRTKQFRRQASQAAVVRPLPPDHEWLAESSFVDAKRSSAASARAS